MTFSPASSARRAVATQISMGTLRSARSPMPSAVAINPVRPSSRRGANGGTSIMTSPIGHELQGDGIEAVTQAGRTRAIGEHVTQVSTTAGADNLLADHAVAGVVSNFDVVGVERFVEAWPASAGVELGIRSKER